jgi:aryl-alcohol dehydrogenase-like predicted oxidoreductase
MTLGTWGLSGDPYGKVDAADAERVVARALELGFTTFDTADSYGAGRMEVLLGKMLKSRKEVLVVTKGGTDRTSEPARKRFDPDYLRGAVRRSLKRLGKGAIDLYLLHNPSADALVKGDATGALEDMKKEGLVRHWGVSAGDVEAARVGLEKGAEVIELAYNLLHSIDLHRLAGEIMVARAGVLARSTLNHGMLGGMWAKDRSFQEGDQRLDRWTRLELERRLEQLEAVRYLVKGDVHTLRAAAVRYVLANHLVTSAVLGPHSVEQLDQLVRETGAGPRYLSDDDLAALPRALQRVGIAS